MRAPALLLLLCTLCHTRNDELVYNGVFLAPLRDSSWNRTGDEASCIWLQNRRGKKTSRGSKLQFGNAFTYFLCSSEEETEGVVRQKLAARLQSYNKQDMIRSHLCPCPAKPIIFALLAR